jgi:hypothetical protein
MKDKTFTVQYSRTDTGCLQVFIMKNGKYLENLTVFPDNSTWLDLDDSNKAQVNVYPLNALHRVWYKEVCKACGWESEPFEGIPCGPGGTLNCPACQEAKRNGPFIEGAYGSVEAVQLDWETKKPLIQDCENAQQETKE